MNSDKIIEKESESNNYLNSNPKDILLCEKILLRGFGPDKEYLNMEYYAYELAYHSEFFYKCLTNTFEEKKTKLIDLSKIFNDPDGFISLNKILKGEYSIKQLPELFIDCIEYLKYLQMDKIALLVSDYIEISKYYIINEYTYVSSLICLDHFGLIDREDFYTIHDIINKIHDENMDNQEILLSMMTDELKTIILDHIFKYFLTQHIDYKNSKKTVNWK